VEEVDQAAVSSALSGRNTSWTKDLLPWNSDGVWVAASSRSACEIRAGCDVGGRLLATFTVFF
jgi:hypothetical protein